MSGIGRAPIFFSNRHPAEHDSFQPPCPGIRAHGFADVFAVRGAYKGGEEGEAGACPSRDLTATTFTAFR